MIEKDATPGIVVTKGIRVSYLAHRRCILLNDTIKLKIFIMKRFDGKVKECYPKGKQPTMLNHFTL